MIGEIVATPQGRETYKDFDQLAKAALDKARAAHDPEAMVAVATAWPHSLIAEESQFNASEEYYLQSHKLGAEEASYAVGNAMKYLSIAANGSGKFRSQARLAMAMIYAAGKWNAMAQLSLDQLEGVDLQSDFAFADLHGKVSEIVQRIGKLPPLPPPAEICQLKMPVDQLFSISGQSVTVLTDHANNPVRLGEGVLVLKDDRLVLVDTQAKDADAAITWEGLWDAQAPPPSPDNGFYSGQPFSKPVIAGLSSDRKVIGVVGYGYARGLDVRSAKIVWKHALGEYGNPAPNMPLAVGEGVLVYASQSGAVVCVDLATGLLAWTSEPSSAFRGLVGPPTICGGMVLGQCNGGKSLVCWDVRNGKVSGGDPGQQLGDGSIHASRRPGGPGGRRVVGARAGRPSAAGLGCASTRGTRRRRARRRRIASWSCPTVPATRWT